MRKFIIIPLLASAILFSCNVQPKPEEAIIGKWKFDRIDAGAAQEQMNMGDNLKVGMLEGIMRGMSYEFFKDKSYQLESQGMLGEKKKDGTYSLIHDGTSIEITKTNAQGESKNETFDIEVLNNDSLVFGKMGVKMIFLKAK